MKEGHTMSDHKADSEVYLGDGLYGSFDGWQIKLRAPRIDGDHEVFLDPYVLQAFDRWRSSLKSGL